MLKKLSPLLLICSFELLAATLRVAPIANDDYASVIVGIQPSISVNLSSNDRYGSIVTLNGSTSGQYGYLQLSGTTAIYTLYDNPTNAALKAGQSVTDTFNYSYANDAGQSASARLVIQVTGNQHPPVAVDDYASVMPNKIDSVTDNVITNDKNGTNVYLNSSPASDYGYLILNPSGSFTYTVYIAAPSVTKLKAGETVTDSFSYTVVDQYGQSAIAKLNITVIGNPVDASGNTIFPQPVGTLYDNVDIEPNDRSAYATPLNSGRNIQGSLYDGEDKDWYKLQSAGNEIITINVCPTGSSCSGKKSWVVYVFDSAKLTATMEEKNFPLSHWIDATGSVYDESGIQRLGANPYTTSNHMYLAYQMGRYFQGALIDVVDPCFDTTTSLNIGVGPGARNYLIAVSSTLMGNDGSGKPSGKCGDGGTVLRQAGVSVSGLDGDGKTKTYPTTEEYYMHFPWSDDQYTIQITGTGINPLLSSTAASGSAAFNALTGELYIPKIRIGDALYEAKLLLQNSLSGTNPLITNSTSKNSLRFSLSSLKRLTSNVIADEFQATYDSAKQQVIIPRVTDIINSNSFNTPPNAYSVIMQYHPEVAGSAQWLEVTNSALIQ